MQVVPTGWTAEERDTTRKITATTQVAWKKTLNNAIRLFTIGVSTIGGTDTIASGGGVNSDWTNYQYQNESTYLKNISVGMPRTPYFCGVLGLSSMFILATVNLPENSLAIVSKSGAIILQGPHHSAQ